MNSRAHILISCTVQGVNFRWDTRDKASEMDLRGWVRNNSDGTVEIAAEGERAQIEELISWARHGPSFAHVTGFDVKWEEYTGEFKKFEIRF